MKKATVFLGVFALGGVFAQYGYAQIASDGSLPRKNKFDTVEVLAKSPSDNELRKHSVVAKQVYGREEIDRFGDTTLADVLSNLPGIRVINGAPSLSGIDPKYTKLLFDGQPVPAGVTMEQINPALIKRIEVTRGQTAATSSQAIAGTINILFKDPPRSTQESARYGLQYQNEHPTPVGTYTVGGKYGSWSYSLPVSTQELLQTYQVNAEKQFTGADGLQSRGYQERYWRYNLTQLTFAPRISYAMDEDEKVTSNSFIQVAHRLLEHRYARTVLQGSPQLNDDFNSDTVYRIFNTDLAWAKNLSGTDRAEVIAGYNATHYLGASYYSRDGALTANKNEDEVENAVKLKATYQSLVNDKHALTYGIDLNRQRQYQWANDVTKGVPVDPLLMGSVFQNIIDTSAVFVEDEWEYDSALAFNIGVRSETLGMGVETPIQVANLYGYDTSARSSFNVTSPVMHFRYKPDEKNLVRGSVSRTYKAPDMSSLSLLPWISYRDTSVSNSPAAPDVIGNGAIRPELATGLDLAYETQFGKSGVFSVGGFYRDVKDIVMNVVSLQQVFWASAPRWVTQPMNFSHGTSYGLEFEVRAPAGDVLPTMLVPGNPLNLRMNLNFYGSQIDAIAGPNNRFPQQSPWSATVGFDYKPSGAVSIGASLYATPSYARQGPLSSDIVTQENLRWINAFIQYKVDASSTLRVGLNNLFPVANATDVATANSDLRSNRTGRTALSVVYEVRIK